MEMRLLRDFLVLSKVLNFSKACDKLHISQPVLSRHIKILEDNLRTQLLQRTTHCVKLTPSGEIFAEKAKAVVMQYDECIASMHDYNNNQARSLRIAFQSYASQQILSSFLKFLDEHMPEIKIDCYAAEQDQIVDNIDQGECDVAFIVNGNGCRIDDHLSHYIAFKDPERVAMNKRHPLAGQKVISIHQIVEWPQLSISHELQPLASVVQHYSLRRHGLNFKIGGEYPNLESCAFRLRFDDEAVLLLPQHRAEVISTECVVKPIAEPDCWVSVEAVWASKILNPDVKKFLDNFKEFMASEHNLCVVPLPAEKRA